MNEVNPVARSLRCHIQPGGAQQCQALLQGLFEALQAFPGCVSASLVPPSQAEEPWQLLQRFANPGDLARWQASPEWAQWRARLEPVAVLHDCGLVAGLQTWSAPPLPAPVMVPPKWKLTVVSWMGIFPLVSVSLGVLGPLLQSWPFLARIFVVTVLVVSLMSYVVMPRLVAWMAWWLRRK